MFIKKNSSASVLKVLDCTFRDGGYYNNWDFDTLVVQKYLHAIANANIDIVELGFRNFPQDFFLGAFAYTSDTYINSLDISDHIFVCVMIDANSILKSDYSINDAIRLLFQPKERSRVDLVRIATHFSNVNQCHEIARVLKKMGYQVGLNLMQPNDKTSSELAIVAQLVQCWQLVDVLYFADSLGSMNNDDVVRVLSTLKLNWFGEIGFHAHNNRGLAVANSIVAIDNGATWVDCTVLGMGRGAGNAQTENLLLELERKYSLNYKASALFDIVLSDFRPLQKHYCWGESLLYSLAAMNSIHPTYVQEMLIDSRYSVREILQAINFMSSLDSSNYDKDLLLHAHGNANNKGSWNAKGWCMHKEVLVLGSGKSLEKYRRGVEQYIKTYNPIVVDINTKHNFPKELIDVYLSSNESNMLSEYDSYVQLDKPIIISKKLLESVIGKKANIKELWDYGLNIRNNTFMVDNTECTLPYELTIGYALALPISVLTPTTYQIQQGSIYACKI